jgi:galactonate dehydratase
VGWGEAAPGAEREIRRVETLVRGRSAGAFEELRQRLAGAPELEPAVGMAALDVAARQAKVPVHQFLGGPTRTKVRILSRLDDASPSGMKAALAAGQRAFLTPLPQASLRTPPARNHGQALAAAARAQLEALRGTLGPDADFVLDGQAALTPGDASFVAAACESLRPMWLDEPCGPVGLAPLRKIAGESGVPIGLGRGLRGAPGGAAFLDLLREQVVDVLRPDLHAMSLTQIRRSAALAETYYVAVAPLHAGGPVATAAGLQLAACLPNFFALEIPIPRAEADRRFRAALAGAALERVTDGSAALPTGPGLGLTIDERALGHTSPAARPGGAP